MKRTRILWTLATLAAGTAAWLAGCMSSNELGGTPIPNALPDTRISGQPPSLLEASFLVEFHWTGGDPDGQVVGYQWKLSENGTDGISVQDTLTVDPATGDTLHPWFFTTATDTILIVSADLPGFPNDSSLPPTHQRSYQTHTLFVRSVDDKGGLDPTPAFISFTATTLLPTIDVDRPERLSGYTDVQAAPPTVTFGFSGGDPDFDLGIPVKYRYIWKPAWVENPPHYVRTKYEMDQRMDELVSFADSSWSAWLPYPSDPANRLVSFPGSFRDSAGRQITYVFAIQAQDTAGAVSIDRTYAKNVQNVYITQGMTPYLITEERYLGRFEATGENVRITEDVAQGQLLEFIWSANADLYAGVVESYRYGWDLVDPNDENDLNWALLPGNSAQHRRTPPASFGSGTHTLTIQCMDNSNQITRITFVLDVVPVPEPAAQRQVLLVDDVQDRTSNAWVAQDRITPLDNDRYRDEFWEDTLGGQGGVVGFDPLQDVVDLELSPLKYRDIVGYRSLVWISRYAVGNFIHAQFKPTTPAGDEKFIWLASYQEAVGNLLLAGGRVLNEFIEERTWMIPWVFNSSESTAQFGNNVYSVGFGTRELPDGTVVLRGRERYPYRIAGISVLDHMTPRYNVYGLTGGGSTTNAARNSACVGTKGLILDPEFKSRYMPEGGVFPDTIYTNNVIDWQDRRAGYADSLNAWSWGNTEFYDVNITTRSTAWSPQICDDGPCVEPMFRSYSRYDRIDDMHAAAGDSIWPFNLFDGDALVGKCGRWAIDIGTGRSRTTGHPVGFISHKVEASKPNGKGDVIWGFDPYRFNKEQIQNAIHWVLGEHFGLLLE